MIVSPGHDIKLPGAIMPMKQRVAWITPSDETHYLVGPEGLVWSQPAIGEAFILAANDERQRSDAADFLMGLLGMGLVPYGIPLNHRQTIATFGGPVTRDCRWVPHAEAPAPAGDEGDDLPTRAALILPESGPAFNDYLVAQARRIVGEFGADRLDAMPIAVANRHRQAMAAQLVEETGCKRDAARRNIAKASHQLRHPDFADEKKAWGRPRRPQA